ncbi:uncharacterized protein LOC100023060 isoform X12 [Monodelphis domestica]|uniref:uncharacterized protein LOC100023060 isoform X12 n=1 Tax=Monodelphis domestica TaxID=13616 RepID=UPI0024E224AC|nr:uncharacterized protein LOC100023060 isoform X12 [Monodelphis domestica]
MDKALDETWGHKDRRTSPLPRAIVAQEAAESLEPGPKRLTKQLDQRVRTPRARGLFLRLADVQGCGRGLHLGAVGAAAAFSEGALQGGLAVSEPEVVRQLERGEALWVSAAEAPAGCCAAPPTMHWCTCLPAHPPPWTIPFCYHFCWLVGLRFLVSFNQNDAV